VVFEEQEYREVGERNGEAVDAGIRK